MAHASACLHPEVDLHGNEAAYSCASEHKGGGNEQGVQGGSGIFGRYLLLHSVVIIMDRVRE